MGSYWEGRCADELKRGDLLMTDGFMSAWKPVYAVHHVANSRQQTKHC